MSSLHQIKNVPGTGGRFGQDSPHTPAFLPPSFSFMALATYGAVVFGLAVDAPSAGFATGLFVCLLLAWTGILVSDEHKKTTLKTGAAFLALGVLAGLFVKFKVGNSCGK